MAVAVALSVLRTADRAAVLLDATRQRLVAHLAQPDSAAGLARRLKLPRQRINYHLRALERAGLVELVEERRKGNCMERLVRATARAFVISPEALGSLGPSPETTPDRMSAEYLISAAARALREVAMLDAAARKAGKRLATFTLDTEIRFPNAAARAAFAAALTRAVADLAAKYHDERAPGGRRFRVLAAVHPVPTGRKDHDQHD
ncbi:MAG: helix-turn-helix domain-containing protein [Gemmatimonadales bacterium]